jgi:DNA polymerase III alpha subunit
MSSLKNSDYVHLHNHTQYSLLDGLTKVPALIDRVKELGMDSVAMTDHGTMSGVIEFYKAATSGDVKPIIGMEAYVAPILPLNDDSHEQYRLRKFNALKYVSQLGRFLLQAQDRS